MGDIERRGNSYRALCAADMRDAACYMEDRALTIDGRLLDVLADILRRAADAVERDGFGPVTRRLHWLTTDILEEHR